MLLGQVQQALVHVGILEARARELAVKLSQVHALDRSRVVLAMQLGNHGLLVPRLGAPQCKFCSNCNRPTWMAVACIHWK